MRAEIQAWTCIHRHTPVCMSASNSVLMPLIDVIIVAMAHKCEAFTNHTFLLAAEKCTYSNSSTDLFFSSCPFSLLIRLSFCKLSFETTSLYKVKHFQLRIYWLQHHLNGWDQIPGILCTKANVPLANTQCDLLTQISREMCTSLTWIKYNHKMHRCDLWHCQKDAKLIFQYMEDNLS